MHKEKNRGQFPTQWVWRVLLLISSLQMAEHGWMKCHEQCMNKNDINEERLLKLEENKIGVQMRMASALSNIGEAMLKLSQSFEKDNWPFC